VVVEALLKLTTGIPRKKEDLPFPSIEILNSPGISWAIEVRCLQQSFDPTISYYSGEERAPLRQNADNLDSNGTDRYSRLLSRRNKVG
jgi:hypothetical protein